MSGSAGRSGPEDTCRAGGSDDQPTIGINRREALRDDATQAIPRWDPTRDATTAPSSREQIRAAAPEAQPQQQAEQQTRHGTTPPDVIAQNDPDTLDQEPVEQQPRHGWLYQSVRELGLVAVIALTISLLVKTFLLQPFWIPSGSMESTLVPGDRVIVSKLTPEPFDLKRGDVVVFEDPGGWLPTQPSSPGPLLKAMEFVGLYPAGDNHLIKRLIGMPGDLVVCCDQRGRLQINGVSITEPYVLPGDRPSEEKFNIRVPQGKVWVMGDHRSDSSDSRFHDDGTGAGGSVPIKDITGRAMTIVWPVDRMGWLSNDPTTFDKVPSP